MSDNNPTTLTRVPTEQEAAMIVAALADLGIEAHATGDITAGFRAGAPGYVQIQVRAVDLPQARQALLELTPSEARLVSLVEDGASTYSTWRTLCRAMVIIGLIALAAHFLFALLATFRQL